MKVKDVMTQLAVSCPADANIGAVVELLWKHNCGMLPVVGDDRKLVGVITDRDICIAMGTRNRLPSELTVGEIAIRKVISCKPDDEIHEALQTMAENHVRRLPVVDNDGVPAGVLSMHDIISHGDLKKWEGCCELSAEEIVRSLKKLYSRKHKPAHAKAVGA